MVLKVLRQAGRAKEGQTEIQVAAAGEARQQRGLQSTRLEQIQVEILSVIYTDDQDPGVSGVLASQHQSASTNIYQTIKLLTQSVWSGVGGGGGGVLADLWTGGRWKPV